MVEKHRPDVIEMTIERELASPLLVGPDLDLVVVAAGHEQWLSLVEVNTSNWAIVLFETINQSPHAVVP